MKKRIKLEIEQQDIDHAFEDKNNGKFPQCSCPINYALRKMSEGGTPTFAAQHVIVLEDIPYKVSRSMRKFMDRFDSGELVEPTTFWITPL